MTDSFPSTFTGPTSKERRYDRQLRLWAASGQQELERSRALLVSSDGPLDSDNGSTTGVIGVEALKNLILPGIGGFTIVDPAIVTEPDLGVNFFLSEESLGKPRAEETCRYLRELNPDVDGQSHQLPILELLRDATFLESFRLVLVTGPMRESTVATISQECQRLSIPLIYMHSVGFYSAISLQLPSVFPIVETHPDPDSTRDLRLTNPWPELAGAATKIDNLDTLDDHQHGHVPYVLLLLLCLDKWKRSHDGSLPKSYQEKREFRDLVRSGARTNNSEGGEENFDEASAAVLKSINPWSMSSSLREIFEMEQCVKLSSSDNFWIIVSAVRTFYTTHGVLPLPGSLPDMKAQSADYVWLQNIYKSKARLDIAEVEATVRKLEGELQLPPGQVSPKEIEIFCKNAGHIKVIQGRGLPFIRPAGGDTDAQTLKTIRNNLTDPESPMPIFVALKVLDKLVSAYQTTDPKPLSSLLDDSDSWERALSEILPGALLDDENVQERITAAMEEARRAGGGELHNMSSFAGGVVAQEALKVLTRQYVPLDNTFIFDGVGGKGAMFRL